MRVLFAVHDWGLGHATRSLPLIRGLRTAGHEVTVLSNARALRLLADELGDDCELVGLRDFPKPLSRSSAAFYVKMSLVLPLVLYTFRRERRFAAALHRRRRFDRIVSDGRLGVCLPDVPSYYLSHSVRQIIPGRPRRLEALVEGYQRWILRDAAGILVPDEPDASHALAGDLDHGLALDWGGRLHYLGILSSLTRHGAVGSLDCLISISGAEPQRTLFERKVRAQLPELTARARGPVVVALGRPDLPRATWQESGATVHSYVSRREMDRFMNAAHLVVTRSGYSTMMELAELGRRALVVPTVGQSEQEYLAAHFEERGWLRGVPQRKLHLADDVAAARRYRGLPRMRPTKDSVERFLAAIAA